MGRLPEVLCGVLVVLTCCLGERTFWTVCEIVTELPDASVVHLDVNVPAVLFGGGTDTGVGGNGGVEMVARLLVDVLTNLTEYKSATPPSPVWLLSAAGELEVGGLEAGESDIEWRPESSVSCAVLDDDDDDDDDPVHVVTGLLVLDGGDACNAPLLVLLLFDWLFIIVIATDGGLLTLLTISRLRVKYSCKSMRLLTPADSIFPEFGCWVGGVDGFCKPDVNVCRFSAVSGKKSQLSIVNYSN